MCPRNYFYQKHFVIDIFLFKKVLKDTIDYIQYNPYLQNTEIGAVLVNI